MEETFVAVLSRTQPASAPNSESLLTINDSQYQFFHWLKHRGFIVDNIDLRAAIILTPSDEVKGYNYGRGPQA